MALMQQLLICKIDLHECVCHCAHLDSWLANNWLWNFLFFQTAVIAQADDNVAEVAFQYGRNIGLAFQLVDDMLDFVSSSEQMGKPTAADLKLGLATAPVLFACEKVSSSSSSDWLPHCCVKNKQAVSLLAVDRQRNISQIVTALPVCSDLCLHLKLCAFTLCWSCFWWYHTNHIQCGAVVGVDRGDRSRAIKCVCKAILHQHQHPSLVYFRYTILSTIIVCQLIVTSLKWNKVK